ncbi:MAG: penicillin-binding protein 2 [Myxococcota bacterium]|nr:penicillin-binding protein 2 [Myxococcota bacterium]
MKRLYQAAELSVYRRRVDFLLVVCLFVGLGLVARLAYLQLVEGPALQKASTNNYLRTVRQPARRGTIFGRSGKVLAEDRPDFEVYVTPAEVPDVDTLIDHLRPILDLDELDWLRLAEKIRRPRGMVRHVPIVMTRNLMRQQVARIETLRAQQPGLSIRVRYQRHYPLGAVGAHVLGYLGKSTAAELRADEDDRYRADTMRGRFGLEKKYEDYLRGQDGYERFVVNARGGREDGAWVTTAMAGMSQRRAARRGHDLVLTIDADVQALLVQTLAKHESGAAVVMDVQSGAILGIVSKPSFDPNAWSGRLTRAGKAQVDNNPYHPMLDKAVHAYFPGSVYKIVTAFASLERGILDPHARLSSPGAYEFGKRIFHCHKRSGHGRIDLATALAASADVFFYKLGEALGIDILAEYGRRFGFGRGHLLAINGESSGTVPTKAHHDKYTKGGFQHGLALSTAVGQGDVRATPVQVAVAYAALANGGRLIKPRLVQKITDTRGETVEVFEPEGMGLLGGDPSFLEAIRHGLVRAVHDEKRGTATKAAPNRGRMAGKTGTAQVRKLDRGPRRQRVKRFRHRDHAWFAGFAPADAPRFAVVVFLEHGGSGGRQAAPVAKQIIDGIDAAIAPIFVSNPRAQRPAAARGGESPW